MNKSFWCLISLLLTTFPASASEGNAIFANPSNVTRAINDPRRPPQQMALDTTRKPRELVAFSGLKSGDRVADFMSGNAYFTRIFSSVVGPTGHVYAFVPTEQVANCSPNEIAGTRALAHDASYANVTVITESVTKFRAPEKVDLLWTSQNYHDLHHAFMGSPDVMALNRMFFDALKPGGIFVVVDHVAEAGSGLRDTETLHRIDPERIRAEVEAAGFVFEAQSNVLRNGEDDHKRIVFDAAIRGKTDQIVFKFRKPQ